MSCSGQELVQPEKLDRPPILVQQAFSRPAQDVVGEEESLDRGQPVPRVGAELRLSGIGGLIAVQRPRRHIKKAPRQDVGSTPAGIQQQETMLTITGREFFTLGGESDVTVEVVRRMSGVGQKDEIGSALERQD
jgi:hypothetical protein